MLGIRRFSRRLSLIACVAIFGLVLAPTLSRVLAGIGLSSPWAEICTPQGARWVALATPVSAGAEAAAAAAQVGRVDADRQEPAAASPDAPAWPNWGVHLDHCPLCGLAGSAPPLASAVGPLAPAAAEARLHLAALQARHPAANAWPAAQARAPPRCG